MIPDGAQMVDPLPPRVLLVDDHDDTTELLHLLLTRRGFEVTTARSVATAVAAIEAAPVDVLVSDIDFPDGSGSDLLTRVRVTAYVPAIALSGHDRDVDVRQGREAGFDEYLAKPVEIDVLVGALRRVSVVSGVSGQRLATAFEAPSASGSPGCSRALTRWPS